jgi:hypothetical protein
MNCPKCKTSNNNYIKIPRKTLEHRSSFEKLMPFSEKHLCLTCGKIYITFLGFNVLEYC